MIILDTNVLSELMKQEPSTLVLEYLEKEDTFYTTAITISEIAFGIAVLPAGKRKSGLEKAFKKMVNEIFSDSILPFDQVSAHHYGNLAATAKGNGVNIGQNDISIAAITQQYKATLWTRNTKDFLPLDIALFNPFE